MKLEQYPLVLKLRFPEGLEIKTVMVLDIFIDEIDRYICLYPYHHGEHKKIPMFFTTKEPSFKREIFYQQRGQNFGWEIEGLTYNISQDFFCGLTSPLKLQNEF